MIEITKKNYKQIIRRNNDVIISKLKYQKDEPFEFKFELCSQGGITGNESGIRFNFDTKTYYKFKDLEEFCSWYLQQRNFMIEYKDDVGYVPHIHPEEPIEIPKHIHCSEVYDISEIPKENNVCHKKITRREKLKDVLELLDLYRLRDNSLNMLNYAKEKKHGYERELFIQQLERDEERIQRFLEEEIDGRL